MKITFTKSLGINEVLKKIKSLNRKKSLSEQEKNNLLNYKQAYSAYEESGELFFTEDFISELTLKKFRKIFTTKRLDILNQLDKKKFNSIAELSRFLRRDIKNIHQDLKILEKFDLVKLSKKNKCIEPKLNVESVSIEFLDY